MENTEKDYQAALETAHRESLKYITSLDAHAVGATADLHALRARLRKPLSDEGLPAEQVVAELARDADAGIIRQGGGRYFAWVNGGTLPAAMAADWLAAGWDQNAGMYATSPAAAVAEEVAGEWLKEILGLPQEASFALLTGCQMAHITCLAAARHALLRAKGWDVEERGLFGAPPIRVLTSEERHGTAERALRILGMGKACMRLLPANERACLEPAVLERALAGDRTTPTIVLLQAGDVNTGAYDSFEELIPLARKHGAWVHVDGAFGLWAAASERFRHLVRGVEAADSWATDGHKWLNVPYDCGYAFVRDREAHRNSMSHREPYLVHASEARDALDWNPEWSRRARAFPTYAALRQLGRRGVAQMIESCCDQARALVAGIGALPGAEIVREAVINQGLVRFLDPRPGATDADHDRKTDQVIAAIDASGEAFFGGTTWRGRRAMRVSVCSYKTTAQDVERVISAFARILQSELAAQPKA
ncbi:MAG: pyridoxal phosphate-dependent decarboxylase family protein [Candidatus Acidiferrales bacterium]